MSNITGQSTDAENSAPLVTAKNAGNNPSTLGSRSSQDIAKDDTASVAGQEGSTQPVTVHVPGDT